MKHLVLTLWFVLFLSSSALAGVEHVTEEVCHAIAGCWVDTKTGECPDCVLETREVVHTHEEKPVVVKKIFCGTYCDYIRIFYKTNDNRSVWCKECTFNNKEKNNKEKRKLDLCCQSLRLY